MKDLIDRLEQDHSLSPEEFIALIDGRSPDVSSYLFERPALCAAGIMATPYTYAA